MISLTGLWIKKDKNGNTYMAGKLGSLNVLVMKNTFKKEDKQPDYKIMLAPPKPKNEAPGASQEQNESDDFPF